MGTASEAYGKVNLQQHNLFILHPDHLRIQTLNLIQGLEPFIHRAKRLVIPDEKSRRNLTSILELSHKAPNLPLPCHAVTSQAS